MFKSYDNHYLTSNNLIITLDFGDMFTIKKKKKDESQIPSLIIKKVPLHR